VNRTPRTSGVVPSGQLGAARDGKNTRARG